ncbi:MAG: hypothetical protein GX663_02395 [Clostridiales bacterium]|nr:hypothetical protein [Clostridiales bacterium]
MENISLSIVTDDREYGRALGLAILNVCNDFVVTVSQKQEFIKRGKRTDLILWDGEEARSAYGGNIVLISEKPSMTMVDLSNNRYSLYKYSPAYVMVGSLFEIYSRLTGRKPVNVRKGRVKLLAFTSWAGGSGCTTLAVAVGRELCRFQKKRVLYLSFEELESTGEFMTGCCCIKSLNQYLYELFGRERAGSFLESYLMRDDFGMEAFAPAKGKNPLLDMNKEEAYQFMAAIIDSGRFDVIVADMATCLTDVGNACVEMADRICMVAPPANSEVREVQYLSHLIYNCGERVIDKVMKVKNMVREVDPPPEEDDGSRDSSIVETQLYIGRGIRLEGSFGKKVGLLAEKMTLV